MRTARHLLTLAAVALISLAACSNGVAVTARVGEAFTIAVGQSAQIAGEDMTVEFKEVIDDSRCPQNVTCVWEGQASSRVTVNYKGTDYPVVLVQRGSSDQNKESFAAYTLTFGLNPYPREGQTISPRDYKLTLTVTK